MPCQLFLLLLLLLSLFFGSLALSSDGSLGCGCGSERLKPCSKRAPKPNLCGLCAVAVVGAMDECVDVVGDCGPPWSMALVDSVAGDRFGC